MDCGPDDNEVTLGLYLLPPTFLLPFLLSFLLNCLASFHDFASFSLLFGAGWGGGRWSRAEISMRGLVKIPLPLLGLWDATPLLCLNPRPVLAPSYKTDVLRLQAPILGSMANCFLCNTSTLKPITPFNSWENELCPINGQFQQTLWILGKIHSRVCVVWVCTWLCVQTSRCLPAIKHFLLFYFSCGFWLAPSSIKVARQSRQGNQWIFSQTSIKQISLWDTYLLFGYQTDYNLFPFSFYVSPARS